MDLPLDVDAIVPLGEDPLVQVNARHATTYYGGGACLCGLYIIGDVSENGVVASRVRWRRSRIKLMAVQRNPTPIIRRPALRTT